MENNAGGLLAAEGEESSGTAIAAATSSTLVEADQKLHQQRQEQKLEQQHCTTMAHSSMGNIELSLGDSSITTTIALGDVQAMDEVALDPELAASMEAALGALAAQVLEMQRRLAATKATTAAITAAAAATATGAAPSAGASAGEGVGVASVEGEDDPWALKEAVLASSSVGEGVLCPLPLQRNLPSSSLALPNSAVKRGGVGPRVPRTVSRAHAHPSRTSSALEGGK